MPTAAETEVHLHANAVRSCQKSEVVTGLTQARKQDERLFKKKSFFKFELPLEMT